MKRLKSILIILILVLSGCGRLKEDGRAAQRLVSTAPSITEILFALDLHEYIVGVSSHCNYPHEARVKTKIGTFSQPNIEKIVVLQQGKTKRAKLFYLRRKLGRAAKIK